MMNRILLPQRLINAHNIVRVPLIQITKQRFFHTYQKLEQREGTFNKKPPRNFKPTTSNPVTTERSVQNRSAKQKLEQQQRYEMMEEFRSTKKLADTSIPRFIQTVKVVEDSEPKQIFHGIMPLGQAQEFAKKMHKNLVLMVKDVKAIKPGEVPLCKITDYRSLLEEEKAKLSDKHKDLFKKKVKLLQSKEIQFSATIGEGDIKSKVNKICRTLAEDIPCRVVIKTKDANVGNILTSKIFEMTQKVLIEEEADFTAKSKLESSSGSSVITIFEKAEKKSQPKKEKEPKKKIQPLNKTPVPHDSPVEVPTTPATQTDTPTINK